MDYWRIGHAPSEQDWHLGGRAAGDSVETAKTLSWRSVFFEPQEGQIASRWAMVRTSFSNFALQDLQVYS